MLFEGGGAGGGGGCEKKSQTNFDINHLGLTIFMPDHKQSP